MINTTAHQDSIARGSRRAVNTAAGLANTLFSCVAEKMGEATDEVVVDWTPFRPTEPPKSKGERVLVRFLGMKS